MRPAALPLPRRSSRPSDGPLRPPSSSRPRGLDLQAWFAPPPAHASRRPGRLEILREEGRPDLADRLLASCDASEASARSPQLLVQIRSWVPDASTYLRGRARSGDPAALTLLARAWPAQALQAAPALLAHPAGRPRPWGSWRRRAWRPWGSSRPSSRPASWTGRPDPPERKGASSSGRPLRPGEGRDFPGERAPLALDREGSDALLETARRRATGPEPWPSASWPTGRTARSRSCWPWAGAGRALR